MKFIFTLLILIFSITHASARDYLITDFGAIGDGLTNNTSSIQLAINKAWEAGGGKVVIPKGKFISGTIFLKSNVQVYFQKGHLHQL